MWSVLALAAVLGAAATTLQSLKIHVIFLIPVVSEIVSRSSEPLLPKIKRHHESNKLWPMLHRHIPLTSPSGADSCDYESVCCLAEEIINN